jgi:hypothetical protein
MHQLLGQLVAAEGICSDLQLINIPLTLLLAAMTGTVQY